MKFNISVKGIEREFAKLLQSRDFESKKQARIEVSNMVSELRQQTPVDTGLARASWKSSESDKYFLVENTTDYIQYLNEGSSKQAPARFIESTALKYGNPIGTIVDIKGE
jgi:hypothetical protein